MFFHTICTFGIPGRNVYKQCSFQKCYKVSHYAHSALQASFHPKSCLFMHVPAEHSALSCLNQKLISVPLVIEVLSCYERFIFTIIYRFIVIIR